MNELAMVQEVKRKPEKTGPGHHGLLNKLESSCRAALVTLLVLTGCRGAEEVPVPTVAVIESPAEHDIWSIKDIPGSKKTIQRFVTRYEAVTRRQTPINPEIIIGGDAQNIIMTGNFGADPWTNMIYIRTDGLNDPGYAANIIDEVGHIDNDGRIITVDTVIFKSALRRILFLEKGEKGSRLALLIQGVNRVDMLGFDIKMNMINRDHDFNNYLSEAATHILTIAIRNAILPKSEHAPVNPGYAPAINYLTHLNARAGVLPDTLLNYRRDTQSGLRTYAGKLVGYLAPDLQLKSEEDFIIAVYVLEQAMTDLIEENYPKGYDMQKQFSFADNLIISKLHSILDAK